MKLAGRKSVLPPTPTPPPPPVVYSIDRSKAVVPVTGVSLTLCCFVVYSTRRFVLSLDLCYFVLVLFSPFSM